LPGPAVTAGNRTSDPASAPAAEAGQQTSLVRLPHPALNSRDTLSLALGVNKIRWMIEQVIAHFKNWKIMSTDYRRPFRTFAATISAVAGLHFYRIR
jgi:hypothetical protein